MVSELSLRIAGGPDAAAEVRRALRRMHPELPRELMQIVVLLASELVSNAVRHTRSESVGVRAETMPTHVRIEIADQGDGFELRPFEHDPRRSHGWGLKIVDELASRWGVAHGPGTRVWFEIDR